MTDRELLELAAKAAGISLEWDGHPAEWQPMYYEGKTYHSFNPLTDNGDSWRLSVCLRFTIKIADHEIEIFDMDGECLASIPVFDQDIESVSGTVRRAIVRAAAEIGKKK